LEDETCGKPANPDTTGKTAVTTEAGSNYGHEAVTYILNSAVDIIDAEGNDAHPVTVVHPPHRIRLAR